MNNLDIFMGRLGKEPELKYTAKQTPVCQLRVAINENDSTNWESVVVWGKQAEICNQYLKKGSCIFVQGQREEKAYKGNTYTEIKARNVGITLS